MVKTAHMMIMDFQDDLKWHTPSKIIRTRIKRNFVLA